MTIGETDQQQLEAYGDRQAATIAAHVTAIRHGRDVLPAIQSIVDDLGETAACERESSCFSGRGNGGDGPYAKALSRAHGRAEAVAAQLREGATLTDRTEQTLTALQARYAEVVADDGLGTEERRRQAQAVNGEIRQALGTLAAAVPRELARAYAAELMEADISAARADVARRIRAMLKARGARLAAVANSDGPPPPELPPFPVRAGVSDTLDRLGDYLPIAMIVAVIELVFPITLWIYAYVALATPVWRQEAEQSQAGNAPKSDEQVDDKANSATSGQDPSDPAGSEDRPAPPPRDARRARRPSRRKP